MAKIILSQTGDFGIFLAQAHIIWLKAHGIQLDIPPDLKFDSNYFTASNPVSLECAVYYEWANQNRTNPLLIECLTECYAEVDCGMHTYHNLRRNMQQAKRGIHKPMKHFVRFISKKCRTLDISMKVVTEDIRNSLSLNDILNKYQKTKRNGNCQDGLSLYQSAKEAVVTLDKCIERYSEFLSKNIVTDGNPYNYFAIKNYDDKLYTPRIIVQKGHDATAEALVLMPIETKHITADCIKAYFEANDVDGLIDYLKKRKVNIR